MTNDEFYSLLAFILGLITLIYTLMKNHYRLESRLSRLETLVKICLRKSGIDPDEFDE
jgi:hypothetical protein